MKVGFHPAALRELREAAAYYEAESHGLGSAFVGEVERSLQQILAFPEASPRLAGPARTKVLAAFPYSPHYSILDGDILVLALAHHRRRPFYWRDRR